MSGVKKWEPENTALGYNMRPDDKGSFVLTCDYDQLAADNKRLEGEVARLRDALEIVSQWRLPKTGQVWPSGGEVSYGACYGSNGERDYMKGIAKAALSTTANGEGAE